MVKTFNNENLDRAKTGGLTVAVNDIATNNNYVTNQPDVVTFDLNQELRRNRPRRQPRFPSRFSRLVIRYCRGRIHNQWEYIIVYQSI